MRNCLIKLTRRTKDKCLVVLEPHFSHQKRLIHGVPSHYPPMRQTASFTGGRTNNWELNLRMRLDA